MDTDRNSSLNPLDQAQEALARGDAASALDWSDQGLRDHPEDPWAGVFRAAALHGLRRYAEAETALKELVPRLDAGLPGTSAALASALKVRVSLRIDQERRSEAIEDLLRAVELQPGDLDARQWACALLYGEDRTAEAKVQIEALLPHRSHDPSFWADYAKVLHRSGARPEAEAAYRRAAELDPGHPSRLLDLMQFLAESGRIPETAPLLDRVLAQEPRNPSALSARLITWLYDPTASPHELAQAHGEVARILEAAVEPLPPPAMEATHGTPLRIGYLSPDFRDHSCAHFAEPVFRAHDRRQVHLTLYHDVHVRTARTQAFQELADRWEEVSSCSDRELAERIREDRIDVLVEMAGHTGFNRAAMLPLRAAPVQVSWLGYPFTTGLRCLDGRITDSLVDPPGNEAYGTEPLLRVDPSYLAWRPPEDGPRPGRSGGGPFTFGSFNQFAKLNGAVVETWAALLRRAPGSRLLLKGLGSADPVTRDRLASAFEAEGVPARRVEFLSFTGESASHLELYREVDLALDPFPYNGVTTTLEALWMEVPVLALEGVHSMARHGSAFLRRLDLPDLVARTPAEYVDRGSVLARDPAGLETLRTGLRARLLASPLCDPAGLARRLEGLFLRLRQEKDGRGAS